MTGEPRFTFRIPQRIADKMIRAKGQAEAAQDYKPITWTEWFESDPRLGPGFKMKEEVTK